jgi:chemotaxis signal transduction protein
MDKNNLEQRLIDALSRLQHTDVDKILLTEQERFGTDSVREQHFRFVIGRYHFVVEASCFCEVFSDLPIAPVPNAPALLAGLCNVRGGLVPVYQLHHEWALALPQKRYVFCVGKGDNTVALLVDSLPHSVDLAEQDCVTDETLDNDSVLSLLVEKTFLARGVPHYRLPGKTLGPQLLVLANRRIHENTDTDMHHHATSIYAM